MRNVVGLLLSLSGALLIGIGMAISLEGSSDWDVVVTQMTLSFIGGMAIGSGLWMVLRRG